MKITKKILILICLFFLLTSYSCNKNKIEVTFDSDGGTLINSIEVKKGKTISKPSDPTKEGYTFVGWYLDDEIFDFNISLKEDITLTAKWNINEYLVTFITDSNDVINNQKIKYNEKANQPLNPTKKEHIFLGWYINDELYNFNNPVTKDITLTAKWEKIEEIKFKITYHFDDKTEEIYVSQNEKFIEKKYILTNDEDYNFDGWYTSDGTFYNKNSLITKDIDVYPNIYSRGLIFDENTVVLYNGDSKEVTIPKYYNGYIIDTIDEEAFYQKAITKITFSDSIKEIKKSAFEECVNLKEVVLNEGLIKIDEKAFYLCINLMQINFPQTLEEIGSFAFGFSNLSNIVFPVNLKKLGSYAFHACNNIQEVTFTSDIPCKFETTPFTLINEELEILYTDFPIWIRNCEYELYREDLYLREYGSNIFPESKKGQYGYILEGTILLGYIKEIGEEFINIDIPSGVTEIADYSFYGNIRIETINLPEGFIKIGKYAFYNCTAISNIYMPSSLKEIDDYAFTGFFVGNNITRLYFPEGFERIGEGAFMSCFNLKYVELPSTLKYIGYLAFGMSNSLERMYFTSKETPEVGTFTNDKNEVICEIFSIVNSSKTIIYVPSGKNNKGDNIIDLYKNALGFTNVVEYIKVKPEGKEVGHYGDGKLFIDLDGCDQATIYTLVETSEDTSNLGGTKYEYKKEIGTYKLNGIRLEMSFETYGNIIAIYNNRQMIFELNGSNYTLKEPKCYYDNYNWTNFVLYDNAETDYGIFDMYGSFITPFEWNIEGDVFKIKIDGNNKKEEHSEYAGIVEYTGSYDLQTDTFNVSFMLNDYDELMNFTASKNNVVFSAGTIEKLYGTYKAYSNSNKEFALYTIVSYANGIVDFYIGDAIYENCTYVVDNNTVKIDLQSIEIILTLNKDGCLEGELFNQDVYFEYVDEVMDSTKLPD